MKNEFNVKNIVRVEVKGNNTYLLYDDGTGETVGNSIDDLEKEFLEWNFVRIHPKHLINPVFFYKVSRFITPAIEMMDGTLLPADKNLIDLSSFYSEKKSWWSKILQTLKIKN